MRHFPTDRTIRALHSRLLLSAAAFLLLVMLVGSPFPAEAAELIVPTGYASINAAIAAASAGDTVVVEPGTYQETLSLKDGVAVRGRETARTVLSGGGTGTIVTVSGSISATISNFTFTNASTGIHVANNTLSVDISNNVFSIGTGTAIVVQSSPGTSVANNVFSGNGVGVSRDADISIANNIFDHQKSNTCRQPGFLRQSGHRHEARD